MDTAEVFVPDGLEAENALARTTHLAIGAHQDDLELMAFEGILACFQRDDAWFTGVVVTNGAGSPRDDVYREYSDEQMRAVRVKEQKKAAVVGEYSAQVLLDYPSSAVKDASGGDVVGDLATLIRAARPRVVYTHNLADKHDTHVAVTLRTIAAIRSLPPSEQPERVLGCEVWRDLDWLCDSDKVRMDHSARDNLQAALMGVFDSQICGGKRYDLAAMGRRRAHATFFESHEVDTSSAQLYAMDLTPLIAEPDTDPVDFVQRYIGRFAEEVGKRVTGLS